MNLALCFFIGNFIAWTYAANILAIFPFPARSHFLIFDSLLVELSKRNHNVTVVTPYPKSNPDPNYHEIDVQNCLHIPTSRLNADFLSEKFQTTFKALNELIYIVNVFDKILDCEAMVKLRNSTEEYDLIITEMFLSYAMMGYVHKFGKPFIFFNSLPEMLPWNSNIVGLPDNPSYIPFGLSQYAMGSDLSFYDRVYNTMVYLLSHAYNTFKWIPRTDEIVRKHFGPTTPSVIDIAKKTSLVLSFSHFTFNYPRPLVPSVVEVGGIHIKPPNPLPKDLKEFLDNSHEGAIYLGLGSIIKAGKMPDRLQDMFINVFRQLPQRVLWVWETDLLPGKPENVMIRKWMPQRDILAHPNLKLFIYHGGSLGLMEAIYEAVPVIGIPLFGEQKMNLKSMEVRGAAETIPYNELTVEILLDKIKHILNDKSYAENVQNMSATFKDRPLTALENGIYWTEYVIRHGAADHLRSTSTRLSWYEYHLLDVAVAVLCPVFLILHLLNKLFKAYPKQCTSIFAIAVSFLCYIQKFAVDSILLYFVLPFMIVFISKRVLF